MSEKLTKFQSIFLSRSQAKDLARDRKNVVLEMHSDVKKEDLWDLDEIKRMLNIIRRAAMLLKDDQSDITHEQVKTLLLTDFEIERFAKIYKMSFELMSNPELTESEWESAMRMHNRAEQCQKGEISSSVAGMQTQVDHIQRMSRPMTNEEQTVLKQSSRPKPSKGKSNK